MKPIYPVPIKPRNLGDLTVDPLYYAQKQPQGTAGQGSLGPVVAPIVGPQQPRTFDDLYDLLARMPTIFNLMWKKSFMQVPREVYSFLIPGNNVNVPGNGAANVVTYTVPDKMCGFITHLGFEVASNAYASIDWSLLLNNTVHPTFAAQNIGVNNLATPYPFFLEVIQSSTISLQARNTTASPINCSGVLVGWLERVDATKDFGGAPSSGIG